MTVNVRGLAAAITLIALAWPAAAGAHAPHGTVFVTERQLGSVTAFDASSSLGSIDLHRAVREAQRRNVAVYAFYAPSVGLTSYNRTAISYGQGALNRLADETGGRAFFQGTSFVTFDAYFDNLRRTLNERHAPLS